MTAPAPRLNGKPDLSGIWEAEDNRPCPPGGCLDMKVGQEFVNIGWSLKGGLPYQPWAAELTKQRTSENRLHDPMSQCLPPGIVRLRGGEAHVVVDDHVVGVAVGVLREDVPRLRVRLDVREPPEQALEVHHVERVPLGDDRDLDLVGHAPLPPQPKCASRRSCMYFRVICVSYA